MTRTLGPINANPVTAWRERGYNDGLAGRESRIEIARAKGGNTLATAYASGYRRGLEKRQAA